MWIWQHESWPAFHWDKSRIEPLLRQTRLNQGVLLGMMYTQTENQAESMLNTLLANIVHSSAIEGEKLNAFSVRSSLARKLGVSEDKPFPTTKQTDGLAEIMLDAVNNLDTPMSLSRVLHWHSLLFPAGGELLNPVIGGELRSEHPMQVVSGRIDRPVVHFEAPPRQSLDSELNDFICWFNDSINDSSLDPLLRAAIVHLWFVTLHPLEDGNGRITRLLTDLALAQAENKSVRFYAMSVGILANRKAYYETLEKTQRGDLDITEWIYWFLKTLNETFDGVLEEVKKTIFKANFWGSVEQGELCKEQVKVLNRMLDGDFPDGINTSQYHAVAKVSKPTATRHLTSLVALGYLHRSDAGGRSTRYRLKR